MSTSGLVKERSVNTIRVVSARTGLTMETLRAWERRYGFPHPERRAGSNRRLYSSADIDRLLAIQRTLDRGYRIGDVVGKSMAELADLTPVDAPTEGDTDIEALIEVLARDDVRELEARIRSAASALGPRRFVTELAHPLAVRIGDAWAEGRLSVRHEHVATEVLSTQLRLMLAAYQDVRVHPLVLLATLPGEGHSLALSMVALYLVVGGASPRLVGGNTPARELGESARVLEANVVGVSVTPSADRRRMRAAIKTLRATLPHSVDLWVGGTGASALGVEGRGVRVVGSWSAIDDAVRSVRGK